MKYPRTTGQRIDDFAEARAVEELVGSWLGAHKIGNLDSTERMDWWVPGFYLDVKEKKQPLTARWPLPAGVAERDAFIVDELAVRKALEHFPAAYLVVHDVPVERWVLISVTELVCCDRVRVERETVSGHRKGKWVVDLTQFRTLTAPSQLRDEILADQVTLPWKRSGCLIPPVVP